MLCYDALTPYLQRTLARQPRVSGEAMVKQVREIPTAAESACTHLVDGPSPQAYAIGHHAVCWRARRALSPPALFILGEEDMLISSRGARRHALERTLPCRLPDSE
jgi:hypothetical protein